jgi:hypothetical protein
MAHLEESDRLIDLTADAGFEQTAEEPACRLASIALAVAGEVRCPVCHHPVPAEHIGYKLHCRRCGYLESCCNPV